MGFALLVIALGATAVALIGYYGMAGRLPRNHWAGIRTRSTMANDEAWERAHRAAGPIMLLGAVAVAAAAYAFLPFAFAGAIPDGVAIGISLALAGLLLVTVITASVVGLRSARQPSGDSQSIVPPPDSLSSSD